MRTSIILIASFFILSTTSCATRVVATNNGVTVVKTRPANYKIVRVKGKRYYTWNGNHYRKTRHGFILVKF